MQSQVGLPLFANDRCAGVDEAGRGPLAGPVVAAAVILHPGHAPDGLDDSKKLNEARRQELAGRIRTGPHCWSIAWADAAEIDSLNILNATMLAMHRAVLGLRVEPSHVQIDGNRVPRGLKCTGEAIVGGDARIAAISAASILAKVFRDGIMQRMASIYPGFGFERHKGYPTSTHAAALRELGPCAIHRQSFRPVRELSRKAA